MPRSSTSSRRDDDVEPVVVRVPLALRRRHAGHDVEGPHLQRCPGLVHGAIDSAARREAHRVRGVSSAAVGRGAPPRRRTRSWPARTAAARRAGRRRPGGGGRRPSGRRARPGWWTPGCCGSSAGGGGTRPRAAARPAGGRTRSPTSAVPSWASRSSAPGSAVGEPDSSRSSGTPADGRRDGSSSGSTAGMPSEAARSRRSPDGSAATTVAPARCSSRAVIMPTMPRPSTATVSCATCPASRVSCSPVST